MHKNCNTFALACRIPSSHKHFTRFAARYAKSLESRNQSRNCKNAFKSLSSSCLPLALSIVESEHNQSCPSLISIREDCHLILDYEHICSRPRRLFSHWIKYLFYIILGLVVLWYVNGRIEEYIENIERLQIDLCDVKSRMNDIAKGYEKDTKHRLLTMQKDTDHKLEVTKNLLNKIKKNQQAHPAPP